jgi:hypothetical protein
MPVVRIVDDEDGTPARDDKDGNLLNGNFGALTRPAVQPRSRVPWAGLDRRPRCDQRQADHPPVVHEQKFGTATKVGTLSRYFRAATDSSEEVLVDPKTMVTVEANSVKGGQLMVHRTFG